MSKGEARVGKDCLQRVSSTVWDAFQELLWPTRCVGCGLPGALLCESCLRTLPWIDQCEACPVCGAPYGVLACTECARDWHMHTTVCALAFEGVSAQLVKIYKDQHELRLAAAIAAAIATALDEARHCVLPDGTARLDLSSVDALSFIPSTATARMRRGFDPLSSVSTVLADWLGVPVVAALSKTDGIDQRMLGRSERQHNVSDSITVVEDVAGLELLLIDDVITTGATIEAAAQALYRQGAAKVSAAAFARVW